MRIDSQFGAAASAVILSIATSACGLFQHRSAQADVPLAHVRTSVSGLSQRVGFLYRAHADCSSDHPPALLVKQQPQHGQVTFTFAEDDLNLNAGNPRHACDKQKIQGELVSYTSAAGWVGSDSFSIEALSADGKSSVIDYTVYVRFTPNPGAEATPEDLAPVEPSDQILIQ